MKNYKINKKEGELVNIERVKNNLKGKNKNSRKTN